MTFEQISKGHRQFARDFPELMPVGGIDHETLRRLDRQTAAFRAEIGEDRWQQLQAEWEREV